MDGGEGPSPRVRGTPGLKSVSGRTVRSIPACAGNPSGPRRPVRSTGVHPRVCGEPHFRRRSRRRPRGPSPRVRGTRRQRIGEFAFQRSIPACAGNPALRPHRAAAGPLHPRVCGEPWVAEQLPQWTGGPSPRVRGTRRRERRSRPAPRSIPACAGPPPPQPPQDARGGSIPACAGNPPPDRPRDRRDRGSIPACAGNPPTGTADATPSAVHPRVCGEPAAFGCQMPESLGPSPRVRGTRDQLVPGLLDERSIPACAGNPRSSRGSRPKRRVHPRVCGEPAPGKGANRPAAGPSPRVRGTRRGSGRGKHSSGSIPACAGNPGRARRSSGPPRVHPRVCGEPRMGGRRID